MSKYAKDTWVPVEQSKMEIERTVSRYGATGFMAGWQDTRASVQFLAAGRHIRFAMHLPAREEKAFTHYRLSASGPLHARSPDEARKRWDQACRQKWRALALLVKAKLEAVDANISTIEEAFFADIVMADGRTVYERAREAVALEYQSGTPQLLLGGRQ